MNHQGQPWAPPSVLEHTWTSRLFPSTPSGTYLSLKREAGPCKTALVSIRHNYPYNYMYCQKAEMHTPNL